MQEITRTHGYLELIFGPMFSGKTTYLCNIYKQMILCNHTPLVINYIDDVRYSDDNKQLFTHDHRAIPCMPVRKLSDISENILASHSIILINEGQFFIDLCEFVQSQLCKNKQIYVCGLDGDFKQEKFGNIIDLIPKCEKITKLNSICIVCKDGTHAPFTYRKTTEQTQTIIGVDSYIPVCRKCLNNFNC
jgi:thymidine kinase